MAAIPSGRMRKRGRAPVSHTRKPAHIRLPAEEPEIGVQCKGLRQKGNLIGIFLWSSGTIPVLRESVGVQRRTQNSELHVSNGTG